MCLSVICIAALTSPRYTLLDRVMLHKAMELNQIKLYLSHPLCTTGVDLDCEMLTYVPLTNNAEVKKKFEQFAHVKEK